MENKMDADTGKVWETAAEINSALIAVLLAVEDVLAENEALRMELRDERDRFDRLTDFELAEAKKLESSLRAVESSGWIRVEDRLPEDAEEIVLVFVSGRPNHFIRLDQTYELATYNSEDGWILDAYPEWETPGVTHWMPLPDGPGEPDRKGGAE